METNRMTQDHQPERTPLPSTAEESGPGARSRSRVVTTIAAVAIALGAAGYGLKETVFDKGPTGTELSEGERGSVEISPKKIEEVFKLADTKTEDTWIHLEKDRFPYLTAKGKWETTKDSAWTSGFYPGINWLISEKDSPDLYAATNYFASIKTEELEDQKNNDTSHDIGFMMMPSFGNGYRLTGNEHYKDVLLTSATTLASRYDEKVGAIRSWGKKADPENYKVIIDNMMNLELLFFAAKHGGKEEFSEIAKRHAETTMNNHIRPDGSVYQLVDFDQKTGEAKSKENVQGHNNDSVWSRGQAWAIGGFTIAYRETEDPRFLDTARGAADFFIANLPEDKVPYWDFKAPNIPDEPKDSSAAAIAASYLLELSSVEQDETRQGKYFNAAQDILSSLISPKYLSKDGEALLKHGTQHKNKNEGVDSGIVYGDYYFLKALSGYQQAVSGN